MLGKLQQSAWMSISLKLVSLTKDCHFQFAIPTFVCNINLLSTEHECRYKEYWPEVHTEITEGQHSPVWQNRDQERTNQNCSDLPQDYLAIEEIHFLFAWQLSCTHSQNILTFGLSFFWVGRI